jgi:hypothetical protein
VNVVEMLALKIRKHPKKGPQMEVHAGITKVKRAIQ